MKITIITIENEPASAACAEPHRPIARQRFRQRFHLSLWEVATRLEVSRGVVHSLVRRGALPAPAKIGARLAFDRKPTQRAIAELKRAAHRRGFPSVPPVRRYGARAEPPLATREVAFLLHVDVGKVRELARRGELKGVWKREGRLWFDPDIVRAFLFKWSQERERKRAQPRRLRPPKGRT